MSDKNCDVCKKGKEVKHFFKYKNVLSTQNPLKLVFV